MDCLLYVEKPMKTGKELDSELAGIMNWTEISPMTKDQDQGLPPVGYANDLHTPIPIPKFSQDEQEAHKVLDCLGLTIKSTETHKNGFSVLLSSANGKMAHSDVCESNAQAIGDAAIKIWNMK